MTPSKSKSNGGPPRLLSRAEILAAPDIQLELVHVPEWGGDVYVRGLSGNQRDDFEVSLLQGKGRNRDVNLKALRAKLVAASVVDGDSVEAPLMFSEQDVRELGGKSAGALQRVFTVAQRLAGLSDEDVEELSTDLGEGQSVSSGTG